VPFGQGFLRTLGSQNYNCSGTLCDPAHTKGDTGGEFVAAYSMNLTFLHEGDWYVPVDDLLKIYNYAPQWVNKTVNASAIEECSLLFKVATLAIKDAGVAIYPEQVQPAPFLPEHYNDFFLGGIDDNAVWSGFMWNRMMGWALNGPPQGPLPPLVSKSEVRPGKNEWRIPKKMYIDVTGVVEVADGHVITCSSRPR
jgi:hypothetical protein